LESVTRVQPRGCDFSLLVPARHHDVYTKVGYEQYTSALFRSSCVRSASVIDIGAHMGYYSLLARQANPEAHIVAVEASPDNFDVLMKNLDVPGARPIDAFNAAFGNATSSVRLEITEATSAP
jgi:predicted RNA methylase